MEPLILLQGVREVSALADKWTPLLVSQRAFDLACGLSPEYKDLPAARNIAATLKMSWSAVLQLAHEPASVQNHRLSRKQSSGEQDWLTDDYIGYVLKLVSHRLGVGTLTPSRYRAERTVLLAVDRARWLHGRQLRLPSDDQIVAATGGWDRALALAGLAARPGLGDQGHAHGNAVSILELLDRCYAVHGAQPSARELKTFARANGIPYPRDEDRTWLESVSAWKARRRASGVPIPDGLPPRNQRPDYARNVGAARPGERRRNRWSAEDCVTSVARYLEQLPAGQRSSKRGYDDWADTQDEAPRVSIFDAHGGWEAVRRKAQERMGESCKIHP